MGFFAHTVAIVFGIAAASLIVVYGGSWIARKAYDRCANRSKD